MDIWFDVDAALAEVPVNIFPLIDDGDFKSKEESIAYNAAGMDLVWNFVTTAGAMSQTEVTPTTGGNYDWANQGNGMYSIEIPASGGASINNDTEGFGWFTGVCTGVLPWRSPMFGFRAAGLNNILIDSAYSATRGLSGTALPDAAADAAGGLPISDAGGLDLDSQIKTDIDAILADTNELQVDDTPAALTTLTGKIDTIDGIVDSILADTNELQVDDTPAALTTLTGKVDTIDGIVDAILADTGTDGVVLANDAITAAKFDESTAFPLKSADAGVTLVARTGADSDTLETLSDQLDNTTSLGPGATEKTYTVTVGGVPLADCDVWVTSNVTGATVIASGKTNSNGQVKFYLDSGATVYIWRQKSGYDFVNPDTEVV